MESSYIRKWDEWMQVDRHNPVLVQGSMCVCACHCMCVHTYPDKSICPSRDQLPFLQVHDLNHSLFTGKRSWHIALKLHAHTHTHARTHVRTHTHAHTHTHTHTHTRTHTRACVHTSTHTHTHTHAHIHTNAQDLSSSHGGTTSCPSLLSPP